PNCGALAVYNKMEDFEKRLVSWDDSMDDADDSMEGNQKKAARAVFESANKSSKRSQVREEKSAKQGVLEFFDGWEELEENPEDQAKDVWVPKILQGKHWSKKRKKKLLRACVLGAIGIALIACFAFFVKEMIYRYQESGFYLVERYVDRYDVSGTSFAVFSSDAGITTGDGVYVYGEVHTPEEYLSLVQEAMGDSGAPDEAGATGNSDNAYMMRRMTTDYYGNYVVGVCTTSTLANGVEEPNYILWRHDLREDYVEILTSLSKEITVIEVTSQGSVYYQVGEVLAYGAIGQMDMYYYNAKEKSHMLIVEDVHSVVELEKEDNWAYYDESMERYEYVSGYKKKADSVIDTAMAKKGLEYRAIGHSKAVTFLENGALKRMLPDGSVDVLMEEYPYATLPGTQVEYCHKLYLCCENTLYVFSKNAKLISEKTDVNGVFLQVR
ncbi:MAG: hypothetical protein K6C69_02445, partial [Lachnospiraceae bacterium]|nr:hypothetical protein [Lachnospiraceae bacterium]